MYTRTNGAIKLYIFVNILGGRNIVTVFYLISKNILFRNYNFPLDVIDASKLYFVQVTKTFVELNFIFVYKSFECFGREFQSS